MKGRTLALIGFMAAGKTTVGTKVADGLGLEFIDTDALIVEREGMPIFQVFGFKGEDGFRDVETEVIREVAGREGVVISLGGGAILRDENVALLREHCVLVHLKVSFPVVMDRTQGDVDRPLLNDMLQGMDLYMQRRELYGSVADVTVDTDDLTVDEVVQEVLRLIDDSEGDGVE